ncbi:Serine acetyltransferase 5 [Camellia lanceoleosa]|uniref:Serine acetyltransferase 5 n=1 Tax=Camellia lanceoleosa TaxID=1840588 RepID=A0ACC0HRK9_9ERIC|nr:Serine acetyltransferase 5 [Camellia lanceoleosa]
MDPSYLTLWRNVYLGNKLCSSTFLSTLLYDLFLNTFSSDSSFHFAIVRFRYTLDAIHRFLLLHRLCLHRFGRATAKLPSLPSLTSKSAEANMCPCIRSDSKTTTPEVDTYNDVTIDTINAASVGTGARKVTIIPKYIAHNVKVKSTSQYIRNSEVESVPVLIPTTTSVAIKKYGISPTAHDTG